MNRSPILDKIPKAVIERLGRFPTPAAMAERLSGGRWHRADHLTLLSKKLGACAVGRCRRLMVLMPPRHGKSELISHWFPVWFLEFFPELRVILTSYEADFAASWGRKARNTIEEHAGELSVRLSGDSSAAHRWDTTAGGGMMTAGVGGPITGKGANILIIDDPVRNAEDGRSKTIRDRNWEWWRSVALTRLEPNAAVVFVMTRWHEDDLAGRILAHERDKWDVLSLPAIAEEDEAFGDDFIRSLGEALWPSRYPLDALAEFRASAGPHVWASLHQQRPHPEGGSVFQREHFRYFRENEHAYELTGPDGSKKTVYKNRCWYAQTCDTALTTKTTSDWTVVLTFAVTPQSDLIVVDVVRKRLEVPDQWAFLCEQRARWPGLRFQGVESKASGIGLIQQAARDGRPLKELKADTDKVTRATNLAVWYSGGNVYHRGDAPWLDRFEAELLSFPNGTFDDQVDCASFAAIEVAQEVPRITLPTVTWSAEEELAERLHQSVYGRGHSTRNVIREIRPNNPRGRRSRFDY